MWRQQALPLNSENMGDGMAGPWDREKLSESVTQRKGNFLDLLGHGKKIYVWGPQMLLK